VRPSLIWHNTGQALHSTLFAAKARREMQPFIAGEKPAIAEPYQLTSLAGHLAIADLAVMDGQAAAADRAKAGADFILPDKSAPPPADMSSIVKYGRQWTDDMFMASAVLSRAGAGPTSDPRYAATVSGSIPGRGTSASLALAPTIRTPSIISIGMPLGLAISRRTLEDGPMPPKVSCELDNTA
jgi:hypothetical protein